MVAETHAAAVVRAATSFFQPQPLVLPTEISLHFVVSFVEVATMKFNLSVVIATVVCALSASAIQAQSSGRPPVLRGSSSRTSNADSNSNRSAASQPQEVDE
jgi:hypothetical protein